MMDFLYCWSEPIQQVTIASAIYQLTKSETTQLIELMGM